MSDPLYTSVISYFANVQHRSRKHEQQRSTVFRILIRSRDLTNHLTQFSFCKTPGCETNLLCAMLNIFVRFKCFTYCPVDIFQNFFQLHLSLHCLQKRKDSDTLVLLNAICTFLPGLYSKDRIYYICNLFSSCRVWSPRYSNYRTIMICLITQLSAIAMELCTHRPSFPDGLNRLTALYESDVACLLIMVVRY